MQKTVDRVNRWWWVGLMILAVVATACNSRSTEREMTIGGIILSAIFFGAVLLVMLILCWALRQRTDGPGTRSLVIARVAQVMAVLAVSIPLLGGLQFGGEEFTAEDKSRVVRHALGASGFVALLGVPCFWIAQLLARQVARVRSRGGPDADDPPRA